jgi:hypothetical protein
MSSRIFFVRINPEGEGGPAKGYYVVPGPDNFSSDIAEAFVELGGNLNLEHQRKPSGPIGFEAANSISAQILEWGRGE